MNNKLNSNSDRGFTLIEVSLSLMVSTFVIITFVMMSKYQAEIDSARSAASVYERLNNVAGSYMTNFYDQLNKLEAKCSDPDISLSGAPSRDYSNCEIDLSLNGVRPIRVLNGMQPTVTDLVNIGLLQGGPLIYLPWPFSSVTATDSTGVTIEPGFKFQVSKICILNGGNSVLSGFNSTCTSGVTDLRSIVYNTHPYTVSDSLIDVALKVLGVNGYASNTGFIEILRPGTADASELHGQSASTEPVIVNPVRISMKEAAGGILAVRNGYGSSGNDRYLRRDGSLAMTGTLNLQNQDISNVSNVAARTGTFGQVSNGINAAFAASSAFIQDNLTVNSIVDAKDRIFANKLKLKQSAIWGDKCIPADESLRLQDPSDINGYVDKGVRLLVCNPSTEKWEQAVTNGLSNLNPSVQKDIKKGDEVTIIYTFASGNRDLGECPIVQDAAKIGYVYDNYQSCWPTLDKDGRSVIFTEFRLSAARMLALNRDEWEISNYSSTNNSSGIFEASTSAAYVSHTISYGGIIPDGSRLPISFRNVDPRSYTMVGSSAYTNSKLSLRLTALVNNPSTFPLEKTCQFKINKINWVTGIEITDVRDPFYWVTSQLPTFLSCSIDATQPNTLGLPR